MRTNKDPNPPHSIPLAGGQARLRPSVRPGNGTNGWSPASLRFLHERALNITFREPSYGPGRAYITVDRPWINSLPLGFLPAPLTPFSFCASLSAVLQRDL
ncbi:hypothetical protein CISG_07623 [Coccidioides immitis RMSCC 3703]|uniref:Uncharacterized protein n=2 Tax=Coccidioides immitis TaxID=5501 RepID=A0A0J8R3N3_COCIT|nr:hypothetical protein CIRG_06733 [Coccidioides immitis RMSCC 2394]KMU78980.1 hypothetical protein CISG_07623 [Coccidioides immitis RMSCC 3703]